MTTVKTTTATMKSSMYTITNNNNSNSSEKQKSSLHKWKTDKILQQKLSSGERMQKNWFFHILDLSNFFQFFFFRFFTQHEIFFPFFLWQMTITLVFQTHKQTCQNDNETVYLYLFLFFDFFFFMFFYSFVHIFHFYHSCTGSSKFSWINL